MTAAAGRVRLPLSRKALAGVALVAIVPFVVALVVSRHDKPVLALTGLVAAVPLSLVLVRRLDLALIAWVAISGLAYPFLRYPLYHDQLTFDRVVYVGFAGALLLLVLMRREVRAARLAWWLAGAFVLFVVVYGVRAVTTHQLPPAPGYAPFTRYEIDIDWFDRAFLPLVAFLVALAVGRARIWHRLVQAFAFLGASVAVLGIAEWAFGFQLATLSHHTPFYDPYAGVTRVGGPYGDPTTYGGVLVLSIAATCFWLRRAPSRRDRAGLAALLALEIVGLAPSYTKTVWIAGLVTLIVAMGFSRRIGRRTALVAAGVAGGAGLAYLLTRHSTAVAERVTGSTANFWARLGDYHQGLLIFQKWPLFGAGFDQFISAQQLVGHVEVNGVAAAKSAHNIFVSVLAESGLLGFVPLVALVVLICVVVYRTWRGARTEDDVMFAVTLLAATVGIAIMSMTLLVSAYPPVLTLYCVVVGVAAARLRPDAEPEPQELRQRPLDVRPDAGSGRRGEQEPQVGTAYEEQLTDR
jgi:O-antigen ligase